MTDASIRYASMAGRNAALYDIEHNQRGYHRDFSNSPAYRDAYDATIAAEPADISLTAEQSKKLNKD